MADNRFIKQPQGLGQLFGPSMGQGLQSLVTQQLDNMLSQAQPQQKQTYDALQGVGFNPQQADDMSGYMTLDDLLMERNQQPQHNNVIAPRVPRETTEFLESRPDRSAAQRGADLDELKQFRNWYNPYYERAKEAEHNKDIYRQVSKLAKSGKLWSGASRRLLNKIPGSDLFTNSETDVFNKLKANLATTATNLFPQGTRITNYLERISQGVLPSLEMNNDTIAAVSDINSLVQDMLVIEEREARKLAKQWQGNLPWNADILLNEATSKELKNIEDKIFEIGDKLLEGDYISKGQLKSGDVLSGDISEYRDRLQNGQTATRDGKKYVFDASKGDFVPEKEWRKNNRMKGS